MSKRYGRSRRRRHRAELAEARGEKAKWSARATDKAREVIQESRRADRAEKELRLWRPYSGVERHSYDPTIIELRQRVTEETLRYARDPRRVIDLMMESLRAEWDEKIYHLRSFSL